MLNSALLHSTLDQCEEIFLQTFLQKRNINNVSQLDQNTTDQEEWETEEDDEDQSEEERCVFDLCSSCAEKEELENVCPRGHQLHPLQLSGHSIYGLFCDQCSQLMKMS